MRHFLSVTATQRRALYSELEKFQQSDANRFMDLEKKKFHLHRLSKIQAYPLRSHCNLTSRNRLKAQ